MDRITIETRNVSGTLDKLQLEVQELKSAVGDNLIATAKSAIEDLKAIHPPMIVQAEAKSTEADPKPL